MWLAQLEQIRVLVVTFLAESSRREPRFPCSELIEPPNRVTKILDTVFDVKSDLDSHLEKVSEEDRFSSIGSGHLRALCLYRRLPLPAVHSMVPQLLHGYVERNTIRTSGRRHQWLLHSRWSHQCADIGRIWQTIHVRCLASACPSRMMGSTLQVSRGMKLAGVAITVCK